MVSYLSKGIYQVKKPAQEQEKQKVKQQNLWEQKESETLSFFLFHCFPTAFAQCYSDKHPLPWQTPLFCSLPLLVICGFRVPTKLCASKGASGKCHFKLHAARKSQTPSQRSQICSKSGQMSAPLSHPPGDCYIWRAEAGDLKRMKKLHNQCCNLLPTSHIVSLQSQNKPQGRKREVYIT